MIDIDLLLVDDEQEFREATSRALGRRGFGVRQAESGEHALELLLTSRPDVVVLDLRMPGMGGIDTLIELRAVHAELPVVILTGHGNLDDALAGIQLGIVDFIQKPVDIDHLASRIRALLAAGGKRPLRERSVGELMVTATSYRRIYDDQPVRMAIQELRLSLSQVCTGEITEQGHRTLLVFDRREKFVGTLRMRDILAHVLPAALRGSPYSSYLTGMLLAQCKLIGDTRCREALEQRHSIDIRAPLMEALNLMVSEELTSLPVMQGGELVGVLRDGDLLREIADLVGNDA